jgi:uncharacterized protein
MGNLFVHNELTADDVGAAKKFYGKLFDWKVTDLGEAMGGYQMIDMGSKTQGGGIQSRPMPDAPTGWLSYVEVKSVKTTMAKATAAGAKAVLPYHAIGEMGAIGVFVDPQGAMLGLWERFPPKKKTKAAPKKAAKKKTAAKKRR